MEKENKTRAHLRDTGADVDDEGRGQAPKRKYGMTNRKVTCTSHHKKLLLTSLARQNFPSHATDRRLRLLHDEGLYEDEAILLDHREE